MWWWTAERSLGAQVASVSLLNARIRAQIPTPPLAPPRYRPGIPSPGAMMLNHMDAEAAADIEACVDQIDEFVGTTLAYPDTALAVARRPHLRALLPALV